MSEFKFKAEGACDRYVEAETVRGEGLVMERYREYMRRAFDQAPEDMDPGMEVAARVTFLAGAFSTLHHIDATDGMGDVLPMLWASRRLAEKAVEDGARLKCELGAVAEMIQEAMAEPLEVEEGGGG